MRYPTLLALLLPSLLLVGCGSSPKGTNPNPPKPASLAIFKGNREITADATPSTTVSLSLPAPIADFTGTGAFHTAYGRETATLVLATPVGAQCVGISTNLPATDAVDAFGNLTLNVAVPGGTATITATLPSRLETSSPGVWQITSGPCAMPLTTIYIEQIASPAGAYTGDFNQVNLTTPQPTPGASVPLSTSLTTPNADAQFPSAGIVAVSLTPDPAGSPSLIASSPGTR